MSLETKESQAAPGYRVVAPNFLVIRDSGVAGCRSQWGGWAAYWRDDEYTKAGKRPYNAGGMIGVDDPEKWLSFDDAVSLYETGRFDGVGVLMSSVVGLIGLDLDDCLTDEQHIAPDKEELIKAFAAIGGYVEISPGGRGLRQFVKAKLPKGYREKCDLGEVYDYRSSRFLTMTGVGWPLWKQAGAVVENQIGLESFLQKFWPKEQPKAAKSIRDDAPEFPAVKRSVEEVLRLLKQDNKQGRITRLLAGNLYDHGGDHSAADLDLCCQAAYFCRAPDVIDAVIRGSGLMRPKWDEMRGGQTYGSRTIETALDKQNRNYDEAKAEKQKDSAARKANKQKILTLGADVMIGGGDDLLTKNGVRSDPWALGQLLTRDRRLLGVLCFDEFAGYILCNRSLAEVMSDDAAPVRVGKLDDDMLRAFARWFGREWGLSLKPDQVTGAVFAMAQTVRINPVKDKLEELGRAWDRTPRLDRWLIDYSGAVVSDGSLSIVEYVEAVSSRFLISAVARAFQPGSKVDTVLILEGAQGAGKSTAVRILCEVVGPEYFREGFHLAGNKDDMIALRGRWILEWSELSGMSRADRNALKTFATKSVDAYRDPYGRLEGDFPRSCVFVATTNDKNYLADPTGNRRYWPLTVGRVDVKRLQRDAPQIIAEAVIRYQSGERWWFDDADPRDARLLAMAEREQSKRVGSTFFGEIAADVADALVCGRLTYITKAGERVEALPWGKYNRTTLIGWMKDFGNRHDGDATNGNVQGVRIDDSNWGSRVVPGMEEGGWERTKSSGIVWSLRPERLEELCRLHGRDVGPRCPPMSGGKRGKNG